MFTVLLMPSGPLKITSFPWDQETVKSDKELKDEALIALIKEPVRASKKKVCFLYRFTSRRASQRLLMERLLRR